MTQYSVVSPVLNLHKCPIGWSYVPSKPSQFQALSVRLMWGLTLVSTATLYVHWTIDGQQKSLIRKASQHLLALTFIDTGFLAKLVNPKFSSSSTRQSFKSKRLINHPTTSYHTKYVNTEANMRC